MPVVLRWFLRLAVTNPITVRLVQNASRRQRHLYVRIAYLGALIAVLLAALLIDGSGAQLDYRKLALAGSTAFKYVAYLQIGLICILAPVFMAGAIAQEADPKTWDILLTTPMSATQIVLGNLFGRLFFVLALLFSSLPLFAVTQFFGGVKGESIFASYLIAGCAALLVGAMAIALSVSRMVGKRAVFTFYIAVVSYIAITIAIDRIQFGGAAVSWMTALNPFLTLHALLDPTGYPRAAEGTLTGLGSWFLERPVTTWCVISTVISFGLMLTSVITVRLGGFVAITGTTAARSTLPWYKRLGGVRPADADGDTHRAGRAVWHNPIAWREAAARNGSLGRILARWSFIATGGAFGVTLILLYHTQSMSQLTFRASMLYTIIGELAVITLIAINMSATAVSREREDGTLDLLLTTPITPSQYLTGKLKGILAYLLPMLAVPIGTLLIAGLYVLADGVGNPSGVTTTVNLGGKAGTVTAPILLPEAGLVVLLAAVPFEALCVIVGMQWSLKSKGTISSVMGTVAIVGVVAGTLGLCAWNAAGTLPVLGPLLAAFSPASAAYAVVSVEEALAGTVSQSSGLANARAFLVFGSVAAAGVYGVVVYLLQASMVKTFDMTVRRLAGTK
ncbi:MAG: ABC transporter permease [Phycisphaerales bacterium]